MREELQQMSRLQLWKTQMYSVGSSNLALAAGKHMAPFDHSNKQSPFVHDHSLKPLRGQLCHAEECYDMKQPSWDLRNIRRRF